MRSRSLLYRILLPPIFLFRFCLPRPPETSSGHSIKDNDIQQLELNYRAQNNLNGTFSTMFVDNHSEYTNVLNRNFADDRKNNTGSWLFTKNSGKRQPFFNSIAKYTHSIIRFSNLENSKSVDINNTIVNFHPKSNLLDSININDEKEIREQNRQRNFQPSRLPTKTIKYVKKVGKFKSQNGTVSVPHLSQYHSETRTREVQTTQRYLSYDKVRHAAKRVTNSNLRPKRHKRQISHVTPPEYMVQLFQLLSGTHFNTLREVVVTGFVNINNVNDFTSVSHSLTPRTYNLLFDVLLSDKNQILHNAELRLYMFCKNQQTSHAQFDNNCVGRAYKISVIEEYGHTDLDNRQIATKMVSYADDIWLSFNVTLALGELTSSSLWSLKVTIDKCEPCVDVDLETNEPCCDTAVQTSDELIMNLNNDGGKGPLLVIFSRKYETREFELHTRHVRDTTKRKERHPTVDKSSNMEIKDNWNSDSVKVKSGNYFQGLVDFISTLNGNYTNSLQNNELNLIKTTLSTDKTDHLQDTPYSETEQTMNEHFISTFRGGKEDVKSATKYFNTHQMKLELSNETRTTAKHANFRSRKIKHSMNDTILPSIDTETVQMIEEIFRKRLRRDTKVRYRRHLDSLFNQTNSTNNRQKRSKKKRVSCQRNEMYVNFETIKWDKVIIFPQGYQAFECTGKCYTPISEYLSPTKHAIIQTLLHTSYPDIASRACCVPTKLDAISVLYYDENGNIEYEYAYEGMVVAECGCR